MTTAAATTPIQQPKKRVISRKNHPAEPPAIGPDGVVSPAKPVTPRMYFNINTQIAIVAYQDSTNKKEKDKLYIDVIMPAFERLTENLINIYKFTSLYDSFDDLKNDCVNYMFEAIYKFDVKRGTNAFSYFNVVAKNFLINRTKQKTQRIKRNVSLDSPDELSSEDTQILEDRWTVQSQDDLLVTQINLSGVIQLLYEIRSKVKSENELNCINGIITIFEKIDEIDIVNKNAILLYMKELTGLTSKQLSTSMQTIKRSYRALKVDPVFLKLL
jgi:hypothetical protein